ncbi:DUF2625 family protein [Clostridium butyricum]|uniref:DUF2625 family protein n=1 Tax=Clostridium butyricum TaxID=1492 RepID=A0AAP9RJJ3_CLOBU|nr:DUF2625 family protein [Clostridium butyricum]MBZ5747907.1 DUF2625 domain-containing protein [Clostridium butyricum]QMW93316.1 DUF2625 family protein [Clostridium butyricum]BBK78764.1 hypothetical protein Cbu04g_37720 [Clostridium butyricum]GEQ24980.1 hypothetical protein CBU03nite_14030 [Clostridium butyricum]
MSNIYNNLWQEINNMFISSNRQLILNSDELEDGIKSLDVLQVTSKSALGSIILNTSGIVIDNWIRILGHDSNTNRGILSYNSIGENGVATQVDKMLIVADDVVGGLFALNAGKFSEGIGEVWYFAPDTLDWESLEMHYSEFIAWIAQGNIDEFYSIMRWSTWKEECKNVKFNEAILIYPFLWSNEIQLEKADKKIVQAEELLKINQEYSKKFNLS